MQRLSPPTLRSDGYDRGTRERPVPCRSCFRKTGQKTWADNARCDHCNDVLNAHPVPAVVAEWEQLCLPLDA